MQFQLLFTDEAKSQLNLLKKSPSKKAVYKAILKTLGYMETNLRHPSLNTHKYSSFTGVNGEEVFESYAQNKTPGAYRIFWYYGPGKKVISVVAITPHP